MQYSITSILLWALLVIALPLSPEERTPDLVTSHQPRVVVSGLATTLDVLKGPIGTTSRHLNAFDRTDLKRSLPLEYGELIWSKRAPTPLAIASREVVEPKPKPKPTSKPTPTPEPEPESYNPPKKTSDQGKTCTGWCRFSASQRAAIIVAVVLTVGIAGIIVWFTLNLKQAAAAKYDQMAQVPT